MKYLTIPQINPQITAGNIGIPHYYNNTSAFILVAGYYFNRPDAYTVLNAGNPPQWIIFNIMILDVNNKAVHSLAYHKSESNMVSGSMTVWNGTTMESEPQSMPIVNELDIPFKPCLIPPGGNITIGGNSSLSFGGSFAGFGFILEDDELKELIK